MAETLPAPGINEMSQGAIERELMRQLRRQAFTEHVNPSRPLDPPVQMNDAAMDELRRLIEAQKMEEQMKKATEIDPLLQALLSSTTATQRA